MRKVLKGIYQRLPVSNALKARLKSALPYALQQPNPALRRFGSVDDLYPWRVDGGLDTRLFVQNYFSFFFPRLDTATEIRLWLNDAEGRELARKTVPVAHLGTADVSVNAWLASLGKSETAGTLLWHVVMPAPVAALSADQHAYYTDRGYIAFVKDGVQPSFMHGIDRYAVFQERETESADRFYPESGSHAWRPEIPLGPGLGCESVDIMTVNRSEKPVALELQILDGGGKVVDARRRTVPARGLFVETLDGALLARLADRGCLRVSGLPTPWSRVMILRHCPGGSVSPMHC